MREIIFLFAILSIANGAIISPKTPPKVPSNFKTPLENLTTDKQKDISSIPVTTSTPELKVTHRPVTIVTVVVPTQFETYDINKDDYVDLEELANVSSTNLLEASRAFNAGDLNRDGLLNWDEFSTFPWTLLTDNEDEMNDTLDTRDESEDYGEGDDYDGDEDNDVDAGGNDDVMDNNIIDEDDDDRMLGDDLINGEYDVVENSNDSDNDV